MEPSRAIASSRAQEIVTWTGPLAIHWKMSLISKRFRRAPRTRSGPIRLNSIWRPNDHSDEQKIINYHSSGFFIGWKQSFSPGDRNQSERNSRPDTADAHCHHRIYG